MSNPFAAPPSAMAAGETGSTTQKSNPSAAPPAPLQKFHTGQPPPPSPPGGDSSLLDAFAGMGAHLDELRKRLILCVGVFIPLFGMGLWLYRPLWNLIIHPLHRSAPHLTRFQALNPSDGLIMAMRIGVAFALILSMPVWLGQIWCFIAPGLTGRERRWLYTSLGFSLILFATGVVLAYFGAIPFALEFLLPFNQSLEGWENSFTGTGYVSFVLSCCIGFGIAFQLPLVMALLGWLGLLTPEALRRWWRPVILIIFIVAAIFTPPDPFTQAMLGGPLVVLFIAGYWLVVLLSAARRDK